MAEAVRALLVERLGVLRSPSCAAARSMSRKVDAGQLTDRRASASVSQALGRCPVHNSTLVNAVDAYRLP